jgi:homoserine kinase
MKRLGRSTHTIGRMGLTFATDTARVRTPATSANLGPGFDALGLALTLYDDLSARITGEGHTVSVTGHGAGELPADAEHLVARAMLATFDELGERPRGFAVECVNRIPQARGLGSSSAAIVGGVQLARALVRGGMTKVDDAAALRIAARAVRLATADGVRPTIFVPQERGYTSTARAALPAAVPHADAAFNTGRAALLVHALTRDPDLLFPATEDRLHQGYRADAMPGTASLVAALRSVGVAAVVSGAGPSVLAFTEVPEDFHPGMQWRAETFGVDGVGALVKGSMVEHAERGPVAAGRKS